MASISVILGSVDLFAMVAEAPDHHGGGPGRVGDGKNGLNGVHLIGHGEIRCMIFAYIMHVAVRRGTAMPIKVETEEI